MGKFDFVIFDFDGTVADTGEGILNSLMYSFRQMGHTVPEKDELKRFIGPPVHYSYTHFYGISEDEVGDYIKNYRERYREKGVFESKLYDGMGELLTFLRERKVKIGIASSKPEHLIYAVSDYLGIRDMFDCIVGVKTDDSRHSTKRDIILTAAKNLGAEDLSRVLMVGDRLYDINGAKQAGVFSCGALWGYGSKEEFLECGADFIVSTPEEILNLL